MPWYNPLTWRNRSGDYVFRAADAPRVANRAPNPHLNPSPAAYRNGGFFSMDVGRLLSGWESANHRIDYYLRSELSPLRARSRAAVRKGPYGKRFVRLMRTNVVGAAGVVIRPRVMSGPQSNRTLDRPANLAISDAFKRWGEDPRHCDYKGKSSWVSFQQMAIACATQDGEFLFRIHEGRTAGPFGFQIEAIDAELLDVTKNTELKNGSYIRLGVEYNKKGKVIRYHFRDLAPNHDYGGGYATGRSYTIAASHIIHGFVDEWPDQSRGIPWAHAAVEKMKHQDKYAEAAMVKARSSAATFGIISSKDDEPYTGDEDGEEHGYDDGTTIDEMKAGTITDIGSREYHNVDSSYPHQMYAAFQKANLQAIASGLGVSYHALANDLEGVNYSSIRAGVLEDREFFKELQEWFIRDFIRPVYERWLRMAYLTGQIRIGGVAPLTRPVAEYLPASYQGRRWPWVDPQKDSAANEAAINSRTRSRSAIIREQGGEPEDVFQEIADENERMRELNIAPIVNPPPNGDNTADDTAESEAEE